MAKTRATKRKAPSKKSARGRKPVKVAPKKAGQRSAAKASTKRRENAAPKKARKSARATKPAVRSAGRLATTGSAAALTPEQPLGVGSRVEEALRAFLAAFDAIADDNPGVTDTDVREILARIVLERLVEKMPVPIPDDFQMMDGEGMSAAHDRQVEQAVTEFIERVEASEDWQACTTSGERKALIARDDILSQQGNAYWLYLGVWD